MPFPTKKLKSKEEEHYNKFCDWMKPLFLQIPLTDAIKLPSYSKYMKDIVSNKRKIPNEEISTMLANYSFNGKFPRNLGRVSGRASEPSRTRVGDDGGVGTFRGFLLGCPGFSRDGEYMGEGARSTEP